MEFHRIDPHRELPLLRGFLASSDPDDYLLEEIDEWVLKGRLWAGTESTEWVAFGRLHDLGGGEGWVSGVRVARSRRGQGLGGELLARIVDDSRSIGLREVRAVIENENVASSRLFERFDFRVVTEMALRCGPPSNGSSPLLRRAAAGESLPGPVGWLPALTGRVDLLPASDGGRFGRWRPSLVDRWSREGKLFVGPGLAVGIQTDWWKTPRTLWANPLVGEPASLIPALGALTRQLEHEEWQAFLPSGVREREAYEHLGTCRHPYWGDRVQLFERYGPA